MNKKTKTVVLLSLDDIQEALTEYIESRDDTLKYARTMVAWRISVEADDPRDVIGMEFDYE